LQLFKFLILLLEHPLLLKILYALFETKELVEALDTYKLYLFNQLILPEVDELNVFHFPVYIQSHQ